MCWSNHVEVRGRKLSKRTVYGITLTLLLISTLTVAWMVPLLMGSSIATTISDEIFSDNFDDGDISDWTVTTTGDAIFEATMDTSTSLPYSVHMKSLGNYKAMGVSPTYTLNLSRNYNVSFHFLIPHTDNHWFEVFNNHQIYLVIDYDNVLKWYNGSGQSYLIAELTTNQWHLIEIKTHPSSNNYNVYINGTFQKTCSMWVHSGLETNFRLGDRADGSTDRGEAYWDDFYICQRTSMPWDITGPTMWIPDNKCDIRDVALVALLFGSVEGDGRYDARADITGPIYLVLDGKIDIRDIALIAMHYGEVY